jgi:hypothetical protein
MSDWLQKKGGWRVNNNNTKRRAPVWLRLPAMSLLLLVWAVGALLNLTFGWIGTVGAKLATWAVNEMKRL